MIPVSFPNLAFKREEMKSSVNGYMTRKVLKFSAATEGAQILSSNVSGLYSGRAPGARVVALHAGPVRSHRWGPGMGTSLMTAHTFSLKATIAEVGKALGVA